VQRATEHSKKDIFMIMAKLKLLWNFRPAGLAV
jgi:hypothetical protein